MTETLVPFSLRLDESKIESIKQKARKLSYEQKRDISYSEIIRDAIDQLADPVSTYVLDENRFPFRLIDTTSDKSKEPDFARFMRAERKFSTDRERKEFLASETGQRLEKSINSDWQDVYELAKEMYEYWAERHMLARKILVRDTEGDDPVKISRDICCIAHVTSRRGAVPRHECDEEEILVPTFSVDSNPTIARKKATPDVVFNILRTSVIAMQRVIDSNMIDVLGAAASNSGYGGVIKDERRELPVNRIKEAFQKITNTISVPGNIIMNPIQYVHIHSTLGAEYIGAPDLKTALKTKNFGNVQGVKINVTERCQPNEVIVLAEPDMVGVFVDRDGFSVNGYSYQEKKQVGMVMSTEVGLCIVNDYAVYLIELSK